MISGHERKLTMRLGRSHEPRDRISDARFRDHRVQIAQTDRQPSNYDTVKTQIKEPCAMSLELPPLVRSGVFCSFYDSHAG